MTTAAINVLPSPVGNVTLKRYYELYYQKKRERHNRINENS
jgi:hypothetical protein